MTVNGTTLGENIAGARVFERRRDPRRRQRRSSRAGGLAVLRGNLAPDGAVIKPPAAEPRLLKHRGPRGRVRRATTTWPRAIDDPDARRRRQTSVLVLQNAGPARRARHARMGHAADPEEAAGAGRARHGAHLRRAHERHQLRRVRAARGAGVATSAGRWRSCATGDVIELDVAGAQARHPGRATRSSRAAAPRGSRRAAAFRTAATARSTRST